ncbi:MAG TPA: hypothetical protein VGH67_16410, partial [Solirubrobacteraceae bacterium]
MAERDGGDGRARAGRAAGRALGGRGGAAAGGAVTGRGLPAIAISASPVTHTGVWLTPRAYR